MLNSAGTTAAFHNPAGRLFRHSPISGTGSHKSAENPYLHPLDVQKSITPVKCLRNSGTLDHPSSVITTVIVPTIENDRPGTLLAPVLLMVCPPRARPITLL